MKKFEGVLMCTDLDGTILRKDKTISQKTLDAIEYFKENGGLFTFITGRMPTTCEDIYDIIKPNMPIGCINGGGIYDFSKKEYVWMQELSHDALGLVEHIDKMLPCVGIQVNTPDTIYFSKDNSAMQAFRRATHAPNIKRHYYDVKEPIVKIIFGDDEEENILKTATLLNEHEKAGDYTFIRSEKRLYEILPKGMSKAVALEKMVEIFNLDHEKTIAVGDYNNDITMVQSAKIGIAVENACEELKRAADFITVSNENDAIAQIIYDLDNKKLVI